MDAVQAVRFVFSLLPVSCARSTAFVPDLLVVRVEFRGHAVQQPVSLV